MDNIEFQIQRQLSIGEMNHDGENEANFVSAYPAITCPDGQIIELRWNEYYHALEIRGVPREPFDGPILIIPHMSNAVYIKIARIDRNKTSGESNVS